MTLVRLPYKIIEVYTSKKLEEDGRLASMKKTRKTRIIGHDTVVRPSTGELLDVNIIEVEERDANFHKLWVGDIVQKLDIVSNKKTKVVWYIIENLTKENLFIKSQKEIEKELGISEGTINETFKALQEGNFLTMVQRGVYRVNPEVVFKGGHNHRMNVLICYKDEKAKTEEPPIKTIETEERMLREKLEQIQRQLDKLGELKATCQSNQK